MTEIVIPPQVRAGRALLDWSQEELARQAGVAVTTVRDVEAEKRAETVAAGEVVQALKNGGVEFVAGSAISGPGVRLAGDRPNVIRRPQNMSVWDGLPLQVEFRGQRFTAFIATEILEDLAEIPSDARPTHQEYLRVFDRFRADILDGVRVAFERAVTWSRDQQHLRVRTIDIRGLVPPEE
jgi:transcriptional regulator with XRE-family HTH domain